MWHLGNRGVVALISVPSGCVFLYNIWGPILVVTISFFLVVYACYSLIINDSLLSPHAFFLFEYARGAAFEVRATVETLLDQGSRYARQTWRNVIQHYREHFPSRMERRRVSNYQLSNDSYPVARNIKRTGGRQELIAELSPIPRSTYTSLVADSEAENKFYHDSDSYNHSLFGKHTSTPMFQQSKVALETGEFGTSRITARRASPMYSQNHTLTRGDSSTYFTPEGSPWGTSISPKMRSKGGGVKTMQTVAGPLLASTRYNIDPKVYNDVTSPGLTTRLSKYATEANTKLTHQSQYGTGQFPKVNLHASPLPLISVKSVKMRMPVTVRVAPPDVTRYSPPGRQKMLSNLCPMENSPSPSVSQALKEISLKRHASREYVASDLAKKLRKDSISCDEFEAIDETTQKRSRDDSSKSEDDLSPRKKSVRPAKRTKTPSCHDILNSLSSSKHVVSGVKRKAIDLSRSGTPDFDKHFKSPESVHSSNAQTSPQSSSDSSPQSSPLTQSQVKKKYRLHVHTKSPRPTDAHAASKKTPEHTPLKGILKTRTKSSMINTNNKDLLVNCISAQNAKCHSTESAACTESVKLTDKLFMRAEPQRNEKLRLLVEEQGSIRAKFTTDDVEEIKKEDIVNMRQTSMKARLKSMFDAISGKAVSRINPDVVIQAEEVSVKPTGAPCPVTCATLNSSTTTTNVNTTPISTSAIVPASSSSESSIKSPKHVAFNIPNKETSTSRNVPIASTSEARITEQPRQVTPPVKQDTALSKSETALTSFGVATTTPTAVNTSISNPTTRISASPSFTFGKPSPNAVTTVQTSSTFTFGNVSSTTSVPSTSIASLQSTSNPSSIFGTAAPKPATSTSSSTGLVATKTEANISSAISNSQISTPAFTGSTFTFGSNTASSTSMPVSGAGETSKPGTSNIATNAAPSSFKSIASTTAGGPALTSTPAPIFEFGSKSENLKTNAFTLKAPTSSVQVTNTFGNISSTEQQASTISSSTRNISSVPVQSASTMSSSGGFDSNMLSTPTTFGSSTPTTNFSFGAPASTSDNKPGFSFGPSVPTTTASVQPEKPNVASTFGAPSNGSILAFGASTTNAPQFRSTTTSMFGNSTNPPIFGTANTSQQPVFGPPSTSGSTGGFGASKTTSVVPAFGSNVGAPSTGITSASSTPGFSGTSGPGIATTNTSTVFGSNQGQTTSGMASTSSNLFSNVSSNVNATTSSATFPASSSIFGQAKSGNFGSSPAGGVFGSKTTSLFGPQTTTASTFGGTNIMSTATPPTFGSTNTAPSTSVVVPTFGGTNAAPATFGSREIASTSTQNPANQSFGAGSSMFGNEAAAPGFGAAATTGGFNPPAANNFSGQNAANLTFGSASGAATFGENKASPFGIQATSAPAFGAPSAPSTSAFGTATTNSGNNNTTNIFTFGSNQKPLQPNATFSFGGNTPANNNTAAIPTAAPFQFGAGANSKPAATGFNFSAPTTTPSINFGTTGAPPTFNASAPGMFSIGSGSTAPRSRSIRARKPR